MNDLNKQFKKLEKLKIKEAETINQLLEICARKEMEDDPRLREFYSACGWGVHYICNDGKILLDVQGELPILTDKLIQSIFDLNKQWHWCLQNWKLVRVDNKIQKIDIKE